MDFRWSCSVTAFHILVLANLVSAIGGSGVGLISTLKTVANLGLSGNQSSISLYDPRGFLGSSVSEGCAKISSHHGDLLFFNIAMDTSSGILSAIQRPVLQISAEAAHCGFEHACEASDRSPVTNNTIELPLFGTHLEHFLLDLVIELGWQNVALLHVCEANDFCGRSRVLAAISKLQQMQITTSLCLLSITNDIKFFNEARVCLASSTAVAEQHRRVMVVWDSKRRLVPRTLATLSGLGMLNVLTDVVFVFPPGYPISDQDFAAVKDGDNVRVAQWDGDSWLKALTGRTSEKYSTFWGLGQNESDTIFGRTLQTLSATQHLSRMVSTNNPNEILPVDICGDRMDSELQDVVADIRSAVSCGQGNESLCSSYSFWNYVVSLTNSVPRREMAGTWKAGEKMKKTPSARMDDLGGRTLRIVTMESPPFLVLNRTALYSGQKETSGSLFVGVIPNMLKVLSRALNFKYELMLPKPEHSFYGVQLTNGSWNGMIGMLDRNEVDLIASDLTVTPERQKSIDFTTRYYEDKMTILLPRSQFDKGMFGFIMPFTSTVWICILGAIAISGPLLYIFSRLSPYYDYSEKPNYFASLPESYMYCYGSFFSQGGQITPEADSARVFMGFWWLFGICTIATYSGNLIAFLTFPGKLKFINDLNEFTYSSNIQPLALRYSFTDRVLWTSDKYKDLRKRVSFVNDYDTALNMVKSRGAGLIGQYSNMRSFIAEDSLNYGCEDRRCHFAMMKNPIERVSYAFGFRKNTNYKPLFDKWIRRLAYSGLINYWAATEWESSFKLKRCQQQLDKAAEEIRKVKIDDVVGIYIVWGCGTVLSILVFLIEILGNVFPCCARRNEIDKHPRKSSAIDLNTIRLNNGATMKHSS